MCDFKSAKQRLGWARDQLEDFRALFDAYTQQSGSYATYIDKVSQTKTHAIVFKNQLDLDKCSMHAQRVVEDLRHALDQAVTACWLCKNTGSPPTNLYFPIKKSKNDFDSAIAGNNFSNIPKNVRDKIKYFEPYPPNSAHLAGNTLLCELHDASKRKHTLNITVDGRIAGFKISNGTFYGVIGPMFPKWDIAQNAMILGKTSLDGLIVADYEVIFSMVISNPGMLEGKALFLFLNSAFDLCEKIIRELESACVN